jgi:ATP-dependent DNA helicase RecQ
MQEKQIDPLQIHRLAREKLGHPRLRPGQEEVARSLLAGHDTLAIMPSGWGKSAIYQIVGLLTPGPTIVVSPLIALQQDQVAAIEEQELAKAALINSTLQAAARQEVFEELRDGKLEFLFLAPEQLGNQETLLNLKAARASLLKVGPS